MGHRPRTSRLLSTALPLMAVLGGSGCAAFRAQIGFGGAWPSVTLDLPYILHLGGTPFGSDIYWWRMGHNYDKGWQVGDTSKDTRYIIAHKVDRKGGDGQHICIFIPGAWAPEDPETYAFEIAINALFLQVRLGFNPYYWFH